MSRRDNEFRVALVQLVVFVSVALVFTSILVMIMGDFGGGARSSYKAVFSNASELTKGSTVRVAGVVVGKVTDVDFFQRDHAIVTFEVDKDLPLTQDSIASVRFLNLIGDRYMTLESGDRSAPRLSPGATIGMSHTTPALNLTALFNGFQPLFTALRPEDVNKLALNLVKVLQGEGGTVQELLANTASLTNALADRDQLIGDVITNLDALMTTIDDHHKELSTLLIQLRSWFTDLAKDRHTIGGSLDTISDFADTLADLLTRTRPLLKNDVAQLRRLFRILDRPENKAFLARTLNLLPPMLAKQTRIGVYGSWYNYYLCEFDGGFMLPSAVSNQLPANVVQALGTFKFYSKAARCR